MFTGMIEEIGTIERVQKQRQSMTLQIQGNKVLEHLQLGDSVAVNGVCLTVTEIGATYFLADVMPETFHSTSLATVNRGTHVNLERAMLNNGRFGGHIVSGHVDGVAKILRKRQLENAVYIDLQLPQTLTKYCVAKGSIAVDGTSLTIFNVTATSVTISLIPHTYASTIFKEKPVGTAVNIETDLLAKYIEKFVQRPSLTPSFLAQHGY